MPDIAKFFPTKWLKATDLDDDDLNVTVKSVDLEMLEDGEKVVVSFREIPKGLVLNKTNAAALAKLHGRDTDGWISKRVTLFRTEVSYRGEMVWAIRLRLTAPKAREAPREAARTADRPSKDLDDFFDGPDAPEPPPSVEDDIPF